MQLLQRRLFAFYFLAALLILSLPASAQNNQAGWGTSNIVDFRIFYPFIRFKDSGIRFRQRNFLGLDVSYQFLLTSHWGLVVNPSGFFIPVRVRPNALGIKEKNSTLFFSIGLHGGAIYRPFANSYFDPSLYVYGGAEAASLTVDRKFGAVFPAGSRASFNLYRAGSRFEDPTLSLTASFAGSYYFNMHRALKPLLLEVGLSLRGSF